MKKRKTPTPPKPAADAARPDDLAARDAAFMPSPNVWVLMDETVKLAREGNILKPGMTDAQAKLILLKGWEVGFAAIEALEFLYFATNHDQGREQIVMTTAGHKSLVLRKRLGFIEPVEFDSEHAVVKAVRVDPHGRREQLFSYDVARADRDGLMQRRSWASGANREGLLLARATSAALRAMFEDAASGLGYTAEEIEGFSGGAGNSAGAGVGGGTQSTPGAEQGGDTLPPTSSPSTANGHDAPAAAPSFQAVPGIHQVAPPEPPAVVPDAPPVAPPDRPLDAQAGYTNESQPRPVRTHGISMQTMQTILKASKEKGGSPRWQEADALVSRRLAELGIDPRLPGRVCYLTEKEGAALVNDILAMPAAGTQAPLPGTEPPPPSPPMVAPETPGGRGIAWRAAYNAFLAAIEKAGANEKRAELEELVCLVSKVRRIEDVADDVLADAAREVPTFVAQPAVLRTLIERARHGTAS